jgi:nucleotide-binding universal stress UspA family protein
VSRAGDAFEIRRILLAVDASPGSLTALEAAVDMAAKVEAELSGLFVEDEDLMRLAESPFARQILYPSAAQAATSRASLEREMKLQAQRARDTLAKAAQRAHIRWSFRSVKGKVTPQLLAAAEQGDVLLLLATQRMRLGNIPVAVYYDNSPASNRALLTAARLAGLRGASLTVLLAAPETERAALRHHADEQLAGSSVALRYRRVAPQDPAGILNALHGDRTGLLVIPSRAPFHEPEALEKLLRMIETPVLWLCDESQPEQ